MFFCVMVYLILCLNALSAAEPVNNILIKLTSSDFSMKMSVETSQLRSQEILENGNLFSIFSLPNEGSYTIPGKPILPTVSRFIVVPPSAGLELIINPGEVTREIAPHPPLLYRDDNYSSIPVISAERIKSNSNLFPPVIAEMSSPTVIRGVRLVKVTTYPVQWDEANQSYLVRRHINVDVRFTNAKPVNPVAVPNRRNRSIEFLKFIKALAINGDDVARDNGEDDHPYVGHYLIVTHENCLEYAVPFIEWRRKSGFKVDILSLTSNQARNEGYVKDEIQDRYEDYLERGIDPFDHILLIGDRTEYYTEPDPQWVLDAPQDQSVWNQGANHADYVYALLEGDDIYPDVAFSRWPSGSQDLMELAVRKTLLYEATPDMEDTDWFTRGGVLSQHWGNNAESAWHISIHTNTRWANEVLKAQGYDDITFFENYDWDPEGEECGPVTRDLFNVGSNMILGRLQNDYFRYRLRGVEANTVFPFYIAHSGHGEATLDLVFRDGAGDNLRGAVATTGGWGITPTAPTSATWMEMINGFLLQDLSFGWARNNAIISIERYFPNFECAYGADLYNHVKTDFDAYGDPAIKSWVGVPRLVDVEYPESIAPTARIVEVNVSLAGDDAVVAGAQVTLYAPGEMPDADDDEYADYENMFMQTIKSDENGLARFILEDTDLEEGIMYLTVTGRDIRPLFREIEIVNPQSGVEIGDYTLAEIDGNGDDDINPGESFAITINAMNPGNEDVFGVTGTADSFSPWIEVGDEEIRFGDIAGGNDIEGEENIIIQLSPNCPDGGSRPHTRPVISINFSNDENIWQSAIRLNPVAPNFEVRRVIGNGIIPIDGEFHDLNIEITNFGAQNATGVRAELQSVDPGVSVLEDDVNYRDIQSGDSERIRGDLFSVSGNSLVVPGFSNEMMLIFQTEADFVDTAYFNLQVGEPRQNAPLGPDGYGYICLDDTDGEWDIAPEYDWIEISLRDRDRDFDGIECDFSGNSPHDIGESETIDIGFTTQFYGEEYNQITICTNGFIAMGEQNVTNFQNWPMDRAIGGGVGMIAPWWDNLTFTNNSDVYYYHDEETNRFIVEWYKLRNRVQPDRDLTFQVILYDRDFWPSATGDQIILFHYKTISNVQGGGDWETTIPYASVGISSPDGTTGISYTWNNQYPVASAEIENERALLFTTSLYIAFGTLHGRVTDVDNGEPISEVMVVTTPGRTTFTDDNGDWSIEEAIAGIPYTISATKQGFNPNIIEHEGFDAEDDIEINFALTHPEFLLSTEIIEIEIGAGDSASVELELTNNGNGPLEWSVSKHLVGDYDLEPWELRQSFIVGELVDDNRIYGVVYAEGKYFFSGANDGEPVIYFESEPGMELFDSFPQPGNDNRGMKDLAWDGELIWGAIRNMVYGFTTEGEVVNEWEVLSDPTNSIAWDSDREVLWMGRITSNQMAYDRNGNLVDGLEIERRGLDIYGLAYWSFDPDGYPLYVLNNDRENNRQAIHKYNPDSGESIFVSYIEPVPDSRPQGAFITSELDPYNWVFINVSNVARQDRIDVWQLDVRKDWFAIEPTVGALEPGESQNFIISLNTADFDSMIVEGEFLFTHDADSGLFSLPVRLEIGLTSVEDNNSPLPQDFGITAVYPNPFNTWSTISFNIGSQEYSQLRLYDIRGREIQTLWDGRGDSGAKSVKWNASNVASGVYFIWLSSIEKSHYVKIALLK